MSRGHHWKKVPYLNSNGYRVIRANGILVPEHRHVMETVLERPLIRGENVHHINGIKTDNDPENLELWSRIQPSGARVIDMIEYVVSNHREAVIDSLMDGEQALAVLGSGGAVYRIPNKPKS